MAHCSFFMKRTSFRLFAAVMVMMLSHPKFAFAQACDEVVPKLVASDGAPSDNFGWRIDVSGDTAIIGSPFDDNVGGSNAGSAYIFVRSGTAWTQQ